MNQPGKFNILKKLLTGLAIINLILLFVFHYELPSFLQHKLNEYKKSSEATTEAPADEISIQIPEDEFRYDGSAALDLSEGVTVIGRDGSEVDAELYSSLAAGDNASEKIITYTAEDSLGNTAIAKRTLLLQNYSGPTITIGTELPSITETQLSQILSIFQTAGAVTAYDGFNRDITSALTSSYTITNDSATEIAITFSVTNMFEESVSETITIPLERTKPLIALLEDTVTIPVGSSFDPISYIHSATNEEAEDLRSIIELTGEVDTMTPGTYELTYGLTDSDNEPADPVMLTVIVE